MFINKSKTKSIWYKPMVDYYAIMKINKLHESYFKKKKKFFLKPDEKRNILYDLAYVNLTNLCY